MIQAISINEYLKQRNSLPLLDVRTPAEFEQAHIPGAYNLPIFNNEERVHIGTTYKQTGREEAILLGFDYTGKKWRNFIETALSIAPQKKIALHCWRGGMRSGAMAWCLGFYGFEVLVIEGGYKKFRNWALEQFEKTYPFIILGGMTGSHKTEILVEIEKIGEQIIDFERLAQHQGSSYGSMGTLKQPSQEQFENNLSILLSEKDTTRKIWVEDESKAIGRLQIPKLLWNQMQTEKTVELQIEFEERLRFLTQEYGSLDPDFLIEATQRIRKRLGYDHAQFAIEAIREERISDFIRIVLKYYDKAYLRDLEKRNPKTIFPLSSEYKNAKEMAEKIVEFSKTIY